MAKSHHFSHVAQASTYQVFDALRRNGAMSRAAIAAHTGITRPTVSGATERLVAAGLVCPTDRRTTGQGRAGVIYEIAPHYGVILAIAVDGESVHVAIKSLADTWLEQRVFPCPDLNQPHALPDQLLALLTPLIERINLPVKAMGISVAAPVDPESCQAVRLPLLPFGAICEVSLKDYFGGRLGCPVVIDNDVNWAALAEVTYGAMQGQRNFICVYLGKGIGAGIYLEGHLIRGGAGLAGELGYVPVEEHINLQDYVTAAAANNPGLHEANAQRDRAIAHIGKVIATASIVVNPDALVLTGPLSEFPAVFDRVKEAISGYLLRPLPVLQSHMPEDAPVRGAACGAYQKMLAQTGLL
ncbi:ROK family transcriptional regulator [Salinimonas sediminis]|uniref:ROK family transcriptional regulator n=1 Tax=Salinimonas sediminis TaxID=2303538 RepID=A0A346NJ45_9ALTE|nr:ROK family transcriptional regulator [Salinimonas sediminis]AXR05552.1 ROK family transcriptional regulator [Salinimonas sediminis]